ncbi:MAG: lipopolysaccharide biosynthesis protein RfbH [Helicobacteraceae bacterium]|jgi:CDP-6-deoxy-D-xylo-4-hexulose-3-dehydrase|nr:lipopolysaccharide biosynthesis protein RfbH [Helicobacteraceae bacterium]
MSNSTEKERREKERIIALARSYARNFHPLHNFNQEDTNFKEGDRINYAGRVYDDDEIASLVEAALEFWLTPGHFARDFERSLAKIVGVSSAFFCSSGSAANLLAVSALTSPFLGDRQLRRGDEVITVAAGFPTTVFPIIQNGAIPVFVDITLPTYNVDVAQLENAITHKSRAVILAHTLGNPFDVASIKAFCKKYNLWLIEDNCDALGSEYTLDGKTGPTGSFGDLSTLSFYPPHHITTGEGGAVLTNDPLLAKIVLSFRDWGRDCVCPSGKDNVCGKRFDGAERAYGELPAGFDHKYVYSHIGYNFQSTDLSAAIGVAQLKKLPQNVAARRKNFERLFCALKPLEDKGAILLPQASANSNPSWFGFPIALAEKSRVSRLEIVRMLESKNVQTRLLFAGNIARQSAFVTSDGRKLVDFRVAGSLNVSDRVMNDVFWIGVYPRIGAAQCEYMAKLIASMFD